MSGEVLDRSRAEEYASWFRALADASRVQILEYLARTGRPLSVGERPEPGRVLLRTGPIKYFTRHARQSIVHRR